MVDAPTPTLEYLQEYSGQPGMVVAVIFIPINLIFVALRFIARSIKSAPWGLDDVLIIPSAITYGGAGYHIQALAATDPAKLVIFARMLYAAPIIYLWAVTIPKLAILAMYLRLFTYGFYRTTSIIIAVILITATIINFVSFFMCHIESYLPEKSEPHGQYPVDCRKLFVWGSMPNIITDVMMLVLPQPVIWKLHTSRKVKLGLSLTFLTGSVGLITSILRFAEFARNHSLVDETWTTVLPICYTIIEPSLYLVAACLPSLRPIFTKVKESLSKVRFSSLSAWSIVASLRGRSRTSLHSIPI
ncbi:integral membrane protein [Rutstroemia sp. NJR-2017a WRK4]|nr:integral membrane protein [Rutstroemia sp. NJR-2017a WRK4]